MKKQIIVVKIGSSAIGDKDGSLRLDIMLELAKGISELQKKHNVILVSSGAVAAGRPAFKNYKGSLSEKKAAAAVGNPLLMAKYQEFFSVYNLKVAQTLCERSHFSDRQRFLQLRKTVETLWKDNIVPIANENDVISDIELKFSDNDQLATLFAVGFGAQKMLMCTSAPGVLNKEKKLVKKIDEFNEEVFSWVENKKSDLGLGGMLSKLNYAKMATLNGVEVEIFSFKKAADLVNPTGTLCKAKPVNKNLKMKWLASSSLSSGQIKIDDGAKKALKDRKSLLAVGILEITGEVYKNSIVEIIDKENNIIAIGKSRVNLDEELTKQIVVHANDLLIL
jgi:glutamate 5-kinase